MCPCDSVCVTVCKQGAIYFSINTGEMYIDANKSLKRWINVSDISTNDYGNVHIIQDILCPVIVAEMWI